MNDAHSYAHTHAARFRDELKALMRIPSVSTLAAHAKDVLRAAVWIAEDMQRIGFEHVEVIEAKEWLPLVYGEYKGAGPDAPTVLIYCHYDVQPADIADGWDTDPFEPVERAGKIYGRGAVDSKSHVIAQLKAAESLLASEAGAPVNIKFLFEGEEESQSEHINRFVKQNTDRLKTDVCVICDGSMPDRAQPALSYALRGAIAMELEVFGPARDLHSGHYGGNVHNPIQALAEIIARLHHPDGRVAVPGFYDNVLPLEAEERAALKAVLPWVEAEWEAVTGAPQPWGEPEYTLHERVGARPTLELNGIAGGFYGDGFKTVLPAKAHAKISCRLVPNQNPARIYTLIRDYVAEITPPTVRSELRRLEAGAPGVLIARDTPAMRAAVTAYTKGWGKPPIFMREGGSVPVIAQIQQSLDAQMVLMAFGYKGCRAHGPNEYVYIDMFHKGIDTAIYFMQAVGAEI